MSESKTLSNTLMPVLLMSSFFTGNNDFNDRNSKGLHNRNMRTKMDM